MYLEAHFAAVEMYSCIWLYVTVIEILGDRFCFILGVGFSLKVS